jgi:hypothetical protein
MGSFVICGPMIEGKSSSEMISSLNGRLNFVKDKNEVSASGESGLANYQRGFGSLDRIPTSTKETRRLGIRRRGPDVDMALGHTELTRLRLTDLEGFQTRSQFPLHP